MQSAARTLPRNDIVSIVESFYSKSHISEAKDLAWTLSNLGSSTRRKGPNKTVSEINDILDALEQIGDSTEFVAKGFNSMPPAHGFEKVSEVILSLQNEIIDLKAEISRMKSTDSTLSKLSGDLSSLKDDVKIIKYKMTPSLTSKQMNGANGGDRPNIPANAKRLSIRGSASNGSAQTSGTLLVNGGASTVNTAATPATGGSANTESLTNGDSSDVNDVSAEGSNDETQRRAYALIASKRPPANPMLRDENAGNPWRTVDNRKKHKGIVGTKKNTSHFQCNMKTVDLFITGCGKTTQPNNLVDYCKEVLNITPVECKPLETRVTRDNSFKLTVYLSDRPNLLIPDNWPENTVVKKFFYRRGQA